jgi:hypothetical protein
MSSFGVFFSWEKRFSKVQTALFTDYDDCNGINAWHDIHLAMQRTQI